jgi:hypothetical protein
LAPCHWGISKCGNFVFEEKMGWPEGHPGWTVLQGVDYVADSGGVVPSFAMVRARIESRGDSERLPLKIKRIAPAGR